ncbi:MAG: hypothetical protein RIS83_1100, partial [Pseudomonadota bacterium]
MTPAETGVIPSCSAEEAQQHLRALVGHAERLDTKLLTDLKGLQLGTFLGKIGIDEGADTAIQGINLVAVKRNLVFDILLVA